ncbi:MAG: YceD family protein [Chthoniobacterales bacterium]
MKVHLRQIPDEGIHLAGEEECPIQPQLDATEVKCTGPLRYNLEVGISEGSLWAKGELRQPVELHCVRCLEAFPFEIAVKDFAIHTDLTGPETVDLTPFMREDILLNLPPYPHCDRDGGRICPVPEEEVSGAQAEPLEARPPDWSALDDLKL